MHSTNGPSCGSRVGWRHYGFVVLGMVVMVVFCALGLARFGYAGILPSMQEALRLTNTQTGLLQSWNLLGYMLTVAGAGALAAWSVPALCGDLFGARLAPAALGWITMVFDLGQVPGPYAAGRLADASQSFGPAFLLAAAVAWLLGAGGTLLLRLPKSGLSDARAGR